MNRWEDWLAFRQQRLLASISLKSILSVAQTNRNQVCGQTISVDLRIKYLVSLFNNIPAVETYNSCQGSRFEHAYVQFGGRNGIAMFTALAEGVVAAGSGGEEASAHPKWCQGMSISSEINSSGICVLWLPRDYRKVLNVVRESQRLLALAQLKTRSSTKATS